MIENKLQNVKLEKLSNIDWNAWIFNPIKSGIFGFTMFFVVVILTKLLASVINPGNNFVIELDDIYLSLIGFVLLFLIKILENFRTE